MSTKCNCSASIGERRQKKSIANTLSSNRSFVKWLQISLYLCWYCNISGSKREWLWIYENHVCKLRIKTWIWERFRSNEHYLSSSANKAWKNFRPARNLNLWPLRYRSSALLHRYSTAPVSQRSHDGFKSHTGLSFLLRLIFPTAQVKFITAKIAFIFKWKQLIFHISITCVTYILSLFLIVTTFRLIILYRAEWAALSVRYRPCFLSPTAEEMQNGFRVYIAWCKHAVGWENTR